MYSTYIEKTYTDVLQKPSSFNHLLKNLGIGFDLFLNILHTGAKRKSPIMKEKLKKLNELLPKVIDQIAERMLAFHFS